MYTNTTNDSTVISQAVRVDRWQSAREYVGEVEQALGQCEEFFRLAPGARIKVTIKDASGTPPITDYVSAAFVAEDGQSVQEWSIMAVGDVIIAIQHIGSTRPPATFLNDVEKKVLARIDPTDFAAGRRRPGVHRAGGLHGDHRPGQRVGRRDPGRCGDAGRHRGTRHRPAHHGPQVSATDPFDALRADLADQVAALAAVVDPLASQDLLTPTPAEGWDIADQLGHLAAFDEHGTTAMVDPDRFRADLAHALDTGTDPVAAATARGRDLGPGGCRDWWHTASATLARAAAGLEPRQRLPWYGPDMGAMSFLTARLMETWAHGQDVRDALGLEPEASRRLRHVADIGVRARPFSYAIRAMEVPSAPIRVALGARRPGVGLGRRGGRRRGQRPGHRLLPPGDPTPPP